VWASAPASLSHLALSISRLSVLTLPHSLNPTYTIHRTRHLYLYVPPLISVLFLVLLLYPRRTLPATSNLSLSLGRTNERRPLYYSGVFDFGIKNTQRLEIESALIFSFPRNVASAEFWPWLLAKRCNLRPRYLMFVSHPWISDLNFLILNRQFIAT